MQQPPQFDRNIVSKSIEIGLMNASAKSYKELMAVLLSSAQNTMTQNGFDFGTSGIVAEWTKMKRKRSGPVTVTFPSVAIARAFHYSYQDYEWESHDCTQTVIVQLKHETFEAEMQNPRVRLAIGTNKKLTPDMVRSIVGGISA